MSTLTSPDNQTTRGETHGCRILDFPLFAGQFDFIHHPDGGRIQQGHHQHADILSALAWSLVASAIFIGSKYWRHKKAIACATCSGDKAKTKSS